MTEIENEFKNKLKILFPLINGKMKEISFLGRGISNPHTAMHNFNFNRRMYSPSLMVHHVVTPVHYSKHVIVLPTIVEFFVYDGHEDALENFSTFLNQYKEYKLFNNDYSENLEKMFKLVDMMTVELL
jgi:hypothetical protein